MTCDLWPLTCEKYHESILLFATSKFDAQEGNNTRNKQSQLASQVVILRVEHTIPTEGLITTTTETLTSDMNILSNCHNNHRNNFA